MPSARRRTPTSAPSASACPACCPCANEEALRLTVLTGLLLNCEIPRFAKFDRKNYFYPDMPKNYQITQYDKPSTANGFVEFEFNGGISRVRITRAHLEEDVGKSTISSATAAWISTAPACRSWKSFPSRTSPARTWPTNISTRSRTS
jgi:Asp-tRNA(Asn)/Glu-tRNA(Gln) amidotransferase B subunit